MIVVLIAAHSARAAVVGEPRLSGRDSTASVPERAGHLTGLVSTRLPVWFEANVGQTAPEVRFVARAAGCTLFVTDAEAVLRVGGAPTSQASPLEGRRTRDDVGTSAIYSTFLGGGQDEIGGVLAVDAAGSARVVGVTTSLDFPVVSAVQPTYGGGASDAFVARLDEAGTTLVHSSYLGGSAGDDAVDIALDTTGNSHVSGRTQSADFPTMSAYQATHGGGATDAFVVKLSDCSRPPGLPAFLDLDQDGADDACASYRNHGDYVSAVSHACHRLGPPAGYATCGEVVRAAARSPIGK
jgi:hypothetical protein